METLKHFAGRCIDSYRRTMQEMEITPSLWLGVAVAIAVSLPIYYGLIWLAVRIGEMIY